jgi:hypothetical protein
MPRPRGLYDTSVMPTEKVSSSYKTQNHDGREPTFSAGICHTIGQAFGREQAQLLLHRRNRMNRVCAPQCGRRDLAHPDATDLALGHKFRESLDRSLDWDIGINTCALKDVDLLDAVENAKRLIYGFADTFGRGIRDALLCIESALDADDDFIGVLRIFREVGLEQMQRIVVPCAVE